MEMYIDRDAFSRGLARVQGIIERRGTHPILSHVLLSAREGGLRLTATDTEVAFIGDLESNVEQPGEIAVDAANLFPVIRSLPDATVHLKTTANHRLEVSSGRASFKLPGVAAEEFPPLPAFDSKGAIKIDRRELLRLVEQVGFAVSTEDVRWGLNGAHLEDRGDARLRMVATDGHRLSTSEASFEGDLHLTPRMLVPRKALGVMKKLLEAGDGTVELSFGEGAIRLGLESQTFWFRLLDGEFPDYQAVIPSENKHRITIANRVLVETLKRVSVLVRDRTRAVKFAFSEDELEIHVQNADRGEIRETLAVQLEGDAITVGFNVRYLLDILNALPGDTVCLELAHPLAPCLVRDPEFNDAFFVAMPMRLD